MSWCKNTTNSDVYTINESCVIYSTSKISESGQWSLGGGISYIMKLKSNYPHKYNEYEIYAELQKDDKL